MNTLHLNDMNEPIISVSGLRGVVGESLTPEIAMRYARAFSVEIQDGPIVLTRDGRASGPMLARALGEALTAAGRDVIDADVAATPTTGVLVRHLKAAGGIQISASHNPAQYNGLKLFNREGRVITATEGQRVLDNYRGGSVSRASVDRPGRATQLDDSVGRHLDLLRAIVDFGLIRKRKFNVLLDANHGAGSILGRSLLNELGCGATILGPQPDGQFEHTPEPTAENLAQVLPRVRDGRADIGFCQDPDADRLGIIDETGRYIGEEYTMALCADHILRHRKGPIVTNCSSSRMSADLARHYGVPIYRSAVGEANMVDAMIAHDAIFGGEGNGGPIDPRVILVRDSFVGMALILDALAAREMKIGQLADELPRYEIVKTKIALPPEKIPAALNALEKHFSDAASDRLDGLRLDWPDRWLLVRGSNTEPIVRSVAEAPTEAEAAQLCKTAAEVLARV